MKTPLKDRLAYAIAQKNMKAVDVCERLNIPKSAMSYYLSGKQEPRLVRLHNLAVFLDVSEAWLMGYDVPMERDEEQHTNDEFESALRRLEIDREFKKILIKMSRLNSQQLSVIDSMIDQFRP